MKREDLKTFISADEQVLWEGKPDKKCSLFETFVNGGLIFLIVFVVIGLLLGFGSFEMTDEAGNPVEVSNALIIGVFFALPVVIYVVNIFVTSRRIKNTQYLVTDKAIYISGGVIAFNYQMKTYADISMINVHKGLYDTILGLGDVIFVPQMFAVMSKFASDEDGNSTRNRFAIANIKDYQEVFKLIKDQHDKAIKK